MQTTKREELIYNSEVNQSVAILKIIDMFKHWTLIRIEFLNAPIKLKS
jgi:hypothetical protein